MSQPDQPHDEIQSFLLSNRIDPKLSVAVSLLYARAMCDELCAALSQWQDAVQALERMKADAMAGCSNLRAVKR
jgi:hypothetical protein